MTSSTATRRPVPGDGGRFDEQYSTIPVQADDKSRVRGANWFAASPTLEGELRGEVAQQCGYRMPKASDCEEDATSGLRLAVVDADAAATVPGVAPSAPQHAAGAGPSEVKKNASLLGKRLVARFGDCMSGPSETLDLVKNAGRCPGKYALEAGFARCRSRLAVPAARAVLFESDAPLYMTFLGRLSFSAFGSLRWPEGQSVQSFRFAARAPSPRSLRGYLEGEGFAYQYSASALALVMMSVAALLPPTESRRIRVIATKVITLAPEARDPKMVRGSVDKWFPDPPSGPAPWGFSAALDNVVGSIWFGTAVNVPGRKDPMLQVYMGGTAPKAGEVYFAFASDCFRGPP